MQRLEAIIFGSEYCRKIILGDSFIEGLSNDILSLKFERYCPVEECPDLWRNGYNRESSDFIGELEDSEEVRRLANELKAQGYNMVQASDSIPDSPSMYLIGHLSFKWARKFHYIDGKLGIFWSNRSELGRAFQIDFRLEEIENQRDIWYKKSEEYSTELKNLWSRFENLEVENELLKSENGWLRSEMKNLEDELSEIRENASQLYKGELEVKEQYIDLLHSEKANLARELDDLKDEVNNLRNLDGSKILCKSCLNGSIGYVFIPCSHSVCETCALELVCKQCHGLITQLVKIKF